MSASKRKETSTGRSKTITEFFPLSNTKQPKNQRKVSKHIVQTSIEDATQQKSRKRHNSANIQSYENQPAYKTKIMQCIAQRSEETISDIVIDSPQESNKPLMSNSRHTGGAVIYLKNHIKYKIIQNGNIDNKIWFLAIEIWNTKINGMYTVFYRSPDRGIHTKEALNMFETVIDKVTNIRKMNVIMGDLNIDLNKINKTTKEIKNIVNKNGLKQIESTASDVMLVLATE